MAEFEKLSVELDLVDQTSLIDPGAEAEHLSYGQWSSLPEADSPPAWPPFLSGDPAPLLVCVLYFFGASYK